jgi:putative FmdB family regulatory protein
VPTYQYTCTECGNDLEVVQSFTEEALTVCPQCSGRLRKVFSPVGVVFKGSGFYRTDSRTAKGGSTGRPGADSKSSPAPSDTTSPAGSTGSTPASSTASTTSGSSGADAAA